MLYLLPRLFRTQALLIYEWIARFPGPWERHWFISDGGFFENLAAYELIRRRLPRIIVCDGTGDPQYQFDELANLIIKARVDFDACLEPFTAEDLAKLRAEHTLPEALGTIDELRPRKDAAGNIVALPQKHAALFRVRYACQAGEAPPRESLLLYLKATLTGDEDPAIRHYATLNPDFPHQSTGDQFFDEKQWENHRALGDHIGTPLFATPWFWKIELS